MGFRVIDILAEQWNIEVIKKKFEALVGEGMVNGQKIMLVKPQTYMNLSGTCVKQIVDFYKLDLKDLLVVYDDIDVASGKIRIRKSGSPGTHNGMRNICQELQSELFPRVRIGTDKPQLPIHLADYVLMPISKEEEEKIAVGVQNAALAIRKILETDIDKAMNEFNKK